MDGLEALLVGPALDFKVEARVVDANDGVGLPLEDVLLAEAYVAEHGAEVAQHFDEAHDGQVADVAHRRAGLVGHAVAAPEAELGSGVQLAQGVQEVGAEEVARGFAGYDIVLHCGCNMLDFSRKAR